MNGIFCDPVSVCQRLDGFQGKIASHKEQSVLGSQGGQKTVYGAAERFRVITGAGVPGDAILQLF